MLVVFQLKESSNLLVAPGVKFRHHKCADCSSLEGNRKGPHADAKGKFRTSLKMFKILCHAVTVELYQCGQKQ